MNKKIIGIIVMMLLIATAVLPVVSPIDNENNGPSKTYKPLMLPFFLSLFNGDWDYWTSPPDMFAIPDGNVGIGTTSPNSKLEVDGVIHSISGGFKFPDGTTQISANVGEGESYWNQDETRIYYDGHVGIGNDFSLGSPAILDIRDISGSPYWGLNIIREGDSCDGIAVSVDGSPAKGIQVWAYGDDAKGIWSYTTGMNAIAIHAITNPGAGVALEVDGISNFDDVVNINDGLEAEGTINFNDVVNINDGLEADGTSNFNDWVNMNDNVNINDVLHLEPKIMFPPSASNGDLVVVEMNREYHIYCYLNGDWKRLDN